ncbi:MAG: penicillin acylase family protein, partial [Alphaproteobacteria bacterium]|nr:penicillin acylase family protein [Alphaproteobacteria bacterium]
ALGPRTASNEWAVDGRHTETGAPILANDPHLGLESPILWYLARIETPTLTLTGATVPGVPILLLGHNGHIAWGFTTTGGDVQDLVVERVDPDDPSRYLTPDGPVPFETREEVIEVRGGEPVTLTVRETRHGPVISDIDDRAAGHAASQGGGQDGGDHVLALAYTGLVDIDTTPEAAYRLNRARSWDDFVDAMALWVAPQQNVIYADTGGRIGLFTPGRVPVRRAGDGSLPVPGWDGTHGWDGTVPPAELPQAVDPADGMLVNANNAVVGPDFPHLIARSYDEGYRAERILEMLQAEGMGATVATHEGMLADMVSLAARDLLPAMLDRATPPDAATADLLARLRRWDHRMDRHEAEPLVFMAWFMALHDALYADELGDLADSAPSLAPTVVERMLTERTAWCDDVTTAATEDCADAVDRALDTALTDLVDRYGEDPAEWRWGDAHTAPLGNQIWSRLPVIAGLVSNAVETHGGHFTVNRGGFYGGSDERPFAHTHGAGFRAVYDLSDLDNSRFVIATGQSGHPMSPHWGDFVQMWAAGGHTTIAGDPATIAETGRGTITLEPR